MIALLAASWLCLTQLPLNPIEQDTLPAINLHASVGLPTASEFLSTGPDFAFKYEMRVYHPWVFQTSLEYQLGWVRREQFPNGTFHQGTASLCALYYRGTKELLGYVGGGVIYRTGSISLDEQVADSLSQNQNVDKITIPGRPGYRLIFGLRYHESISFEIVISQVTGRLLFWRDLGPNQYSQYHEDVGMSSVKLSLGYVWTVRRFW